MTSRPNVPDAVVVRFPADVFCDQSVQQVEQIPCWARSCLFTKGYEAWVSTSSLATSTTGRMKCSRWPG